MYIMFQCFHTVIVSSLSHPFWYGGDWVTVQFFYTERATLAHEILDLMLSEDLNLKLLRFLDRQRSQVHHVHTRTQLLSTLNQTEMGCCCWNKTCPWTQHFESLWLLSLSKLNLRKKTIQQIPATNWEYTKCNQRAAITWSPHMHSPAHPYWCIILASLNKKIRLVSEFWQGQLEVLDINLRLRIDELKWNFAICLPLLLLKR